MFSLIRRISYGVIPRPDRPWEDDPTSNAPRTRRKRRYSSTEREAERDDEQVNKKARGDSATPSLADADGLFMSPPPVPQRDTSEVKEVTEGVKEVDLDGTGPSDLVDREAPESAVLPESIPLPEEQSGELDQPGFDAAPAPSAPSPVSAPLSSVHGVSDDVDADADAEDSDDIASSSEENTLVSEEDKLQKKTDVKVLDPAESTIEQTLHTSHASS